MGKFLVQAKCLFAGAFLLFAGLYAIGFNLSVNLDADAAASRFEILQAADRSRAASIYGERAIRLYRKEGRNEESLAPLKASLAATEIRARRYAKGAAVYEELIVSDWFKSLDTIDQAVIEDHLGRAKLVSGDLEKAVAIYASFLDLAGDEIIASEDSDGGSIRAFYAGALMRSTDLFSEALKPVGNAGLFTGRKEPALAVASNMASLGAAFAMREDGLYAAAGLLSAAYSTRKEWLGGDHQDTVQVALILGPVYRQLDRLSDAEQLYLEAFHAQEKSKGSNNPDLSLYIKLLAGIYQDQGRDTEAQALNDHMRNLFRDAFGARRYTSNQSRDRTLDINRPVSQQFLLESDYAPRDLTSASEFAMPLSKNSDLDEMKIRLASEARDGDAMREQTMPARLATLISLCRSETGERLSLRSGYRSYATQRDLFQRLGHKGTVTPPGMSEHQLGLAADIDVNGRLMRQSDKSYQCFEENGFRFGFILSYPPGNNYLPTKNSFEPWHWRYVGVQTAQLYREAGPTNRPQEFLAALPCYEERAATGAPAPVGENDLCLNDSVKTADASDAASPEIVETEEKTLPEPNSVRKLNNMAKQGRPSGN